MNSQTAQTTTTPDESAIRAFHRQMIDAWNRGSAGAIAYGVFKRKSQPVPWSDRKVVGDLVSS
jgi:hypothetical protein